MKKEEQYKVSVFKDKKDYWVGQVTFPKNEGEKRERKSFYGKTETEATQKAYAFVYQCETGVYVKPRKDTMIAFLNEYHKICSPRWEDTTKALYRMYIDVHFKPYFKEEKLINIKPITLDTFYNIKLSKEDSSGRTMSINTVKKLNGFLKAAFNYALKNGLIKSNPATCVILGKSEKYTPVVYDEENFSKLLKLVKGTPDEIPIILGAGCGLRRSEVFGLQWDDVDFNKKEISIRRANVRFDKYVIKEPKTESSKRTIVAPKFVVDVLSKHKKSLKVIQLDGKIMTDWKPDSYSGHFKKLLKDNGLTHIRFHDLRHYNAVIMLKSGISDKVAADRLGHAQVGTLKNIYQHVLKDMDVDAANQLNKMFETK